MNVVIQINVNASDNAAADQLADLLGVLRENGVNASAAVVNGADAGTDAAPVTGTDEAPKAPRRGRPRKDAAPAEAAPTQADAPTATVTAQPEADTSAQTVAADPVATANPQATLNPDAIREQVKAKVKEKMNAGMTQDALVDIMRRTTGVAFLKQVPDDKLQAFLDALNSAGSAPEEDAFG